MLEAIQISCGIAHPDRNAHAARCTGRGSHGQGRTGPIDAAFKADVATTIVQVGNCNLNELNRLLLDKKASTVRVTAEGGGRPIPDRRGGRRDRLVGEGVPERLEPNAFGQAAARVSVSAACKPRTDEGCADALAHPSSRSCWGAGVPGALARCDVRALALVMDPGFRGWLPDRFFSPFVLEQLPFACN